MKLPRDVSGDRVIKHLCKNWGYTRVNQVGSHVILVTDTPRHHRMPVPRHDALGIAMFTKILSEVCEIKGITKAQLLKDL
jgi:predicted RNA binding protein YcfA (HicA-like mRNA interferase family)